MIIELHSEYTETLNQDVDNLILILPSCYFVVLIKKKIEALQHKVLEQNICSKYKLFTLK